MAKQSDDRIVNEEGVHPVRNTGESSGATVTLPNVGQEQEAVPAMTPGDPARTIPAAQPADGDRSIPAMRDNPPRR